MAEGIVLGKTGEIGFGIAFGFAKGITVGVVGGIAGGIIGATAVGIVLNILDATASDPPDTVSFLGFEITRGSLFGVAFGVVFGVAFGVAFGVLFESTAGIAAGIAVGIAVGISSVRAYYLPLHLPFLWPRPRPDLYPLHPVAWDDLCSVPFPGLEHLLVARTELEPVAGNAEIERLIDTYPSQRAPALKAKTILRIRDSASQPLLTLDTALAGLPEGDKGYLAQTREVRQRAQDIAAQQRQLDAITRPFLREPYARALVKDIEAFRDRAAGLDQPLAKELRAAAQQWLATAHHQHAQAQRVVDREPTPQVFRAGDPVRRDSEAFVQRYGVVGELERQATLATGCPGIVLYGRRRMGKSTVLGNLDAFLPQELRVVSLSMQSAQALTSLQHLLALIAQNLATAIPDLPTAPPADLAGFEGLLASANEKLEKCNRRLLIGLDEYEYLDRKIGQGVLPEDLLSSLRESIQYHRRLVWLFAGSHEITELPNAPWTSYLVSVRTVEVPPFTPKETRLLLTEPLRHSQLRWDDTQRPAFEPGFWGDGGIERIHDETGGWPHLVQLVAETLVDQLNDAGEARVTPPLYERSLDRAVEAGHNVLHQLLRGECVLDGEWDYLSGFRSAEEQPPPDDPEVAAHIRHRQLVLVEDDRWRLRVPLMGRWLRKRG
jgi:hypothetical protein